MMITVLALLCLGFSLTHAENPLKVTVSVNDVKPEGIDVTVTCDFLPAIASSSDSLVSLTISQRGVDRNFTDIATVNALNPGEQTTAQDFEGTVSGMAHASGNASYLKIKIQGLPFSLLLEFQCQSTSITRFGHCKKAKGTASDSVRPHMTSKVKHVKERQNDLEHAKSKLDQCGTNMERLHGKLSAVLKKQEGSELIWVSDIFNASSFYITHKKRVSCSRLNGYLAEINTEEEFYFIEHSVKTHGLPRGRTFILTGASYNTLDGPFQFHTNPGDPVYTGHWDYDEPDREDMNYNWLLLQYSSNKLTMTDGIAHNWGQLNLCEIPLQ